MTRTWHPGAREAHSKLMREYWKSHKKPPKEKPRKSFDEKFSRRSFGQQQRWAKWRRNQDYVSDNRAETAIARMKARQEAASRAVALRRYIDDPTPPDPPATAPAPTAAHCQRCGRAPCLCIPWL